MEGTAHALAWSRAIPRTDRSAGEVRTWLLGFSTVSKATEPSKAARVRLLDKLILAGVRGRGFDPSDEHAADAAALLLCVEKTADRAGGRVSDDEFWGGPAVPLALPPIRVPVACATLGEGEHAGLRWHVQQFENVAGRTVSVSGVVGAVLRVSAGRDGRAHARGSSAVVRGVGGRSCGAQAGRK